MSYWFRQKRYGYGATPTTWQGWTLILATVAVMVAVSLYLPMNPQHSWAPPVVIAFDLAALAALFIVSRHKTEGGFRWRWGND